MCVGISWTETVARLLVSIEGIDARPVELRPVPSVRVRPATRRARRSRRRGSREPRWCLPGWRVTGPPDVPEDPTVECAGRSAGTGRGHRERFRRCRSRGRRAAVPRRYREVEPGHCMPLQNRCWGDFRSLTWAIAYEPPSRWGERRGLRGFIDTIGSERGRRTRCSSPSRRAGAPGAASPPRYCGPITGLPSRARARL